MRVSQIPLILSISLSFSASFSQEPLAPEEWKKLVATIQGAMEPVDQLVDLTVPLLQPAKPVNQWGKPGFYRSKDGGYWMIYSNPDPKKPFERVVIMGTPRPVPPLASVPEEEVMAEVDGEPGVIKKPQSGKTLAVKWKTPEGTKAMNLRYFRQDSGGGADGPIDRTDSFSLTSGGKTGYYVISVESISGQTEKRLKGMEVPR